MPALRHCEHTLRAELQAIADQTNDRAAFLRLTETLTAFLAHLRSVAETLSVTVRQRIVWLVVKDVLGGRHHHHSSQHPDPPRVRPKTGARSQKAQITFCIRGVITPP